MADDFVSTRWSTVMRAFKEGSGAAEAWEHLFRLSWRPLYAFARRSGNAPETADPLVQAFLAHLLSSNAVANVVGKERGRFRLFLLRNLKSYFLDDTARQSPGKLSITLDTTDAETQYADYLKVAKPKDTPESAFDRSWAMGLLAQARTKLQSECLGAGKAKVFASLFPTDGSRPDVVNAELATKLKMNEATLRSIALRLRKRWGELIRSEIAEFTTNKEALEEEMLSLREALASA